MRITRHTEINPGRKAPYPCAGKLVLNPTTEREHNALALFIENGLGSLVREGVAISATFPEEGITIWVCATSKQKVDEVLDLIPSKLAIE